MDAEDLHGDEGRDTLGDRLAQEPPRAALAPSSDASHERAVDESTVPPDTLGVALTRAIDAGKGAPPSEAAERAAAWWRGDRHFDP